MQDQDADTKLIADALGTAPYPRDLKGYGPTPPDPRWPNGAKIALSFVVNFEEGGERSILHGDPTSEVFLHEVPGGTPREGLRDEQVESVYDYGMRAGLWRLMRLFGERNIPFTSWAVGMAVARYPDAVRAMHEAGHEIASHGWRWIDYSGMPIETERQHMQLAIAAIRQATGERPLGWYTGRLSSNTRQLVSEEGGFLYSSDAYDDDLPHWSIEAGKPQLIIPYTIDNNDMKFGQIHGFATGTDFFDYLKDAFDVLYREGADGAPKMMSIGLHLRLVGRPGRAAALARFMDYVQKHDGVWLARRIDIARHWMATHPYKG
ncbi:MAG: allantoinase PuuE [Alphaproteobacteria bacterium]|nr:allantoinase PuuE [Alphaproteobacteria bacterium]MBU0798734.1 allantoinase PuuE [Alphaproteobacteria bacterium]MBU0885997.1 allantoinase PuuE [Alphaproteobacteria bacterium]MBU1811986.1 allantoinase PuuE [Alphaproteobacteria bacterium]MBU2092211.1 allantoinase PuuE [Alphaproteobacteria bacterium]